VVFGAGGCRLLTVSVPLNCKAFTNDGPSYSRRDAHWLADLCTTTAMINLAFKAC